MLLSCLFLSLAFVWAEGQECPTDWVRFKNSCYAFIDEYVPWTSAKVYCETFDARMLEVETQEENEFIVAHMKNISGFEAAWMGLTDLVHEGRWVWISNCQPPQFSHWARGQPDNSHQHENGEDCVELQADGTWNDLWCEDFQDDARYTPSPVCELPLEFEEVIGLRTASRGRSYSAE